MKAVLRICDMNTPKDISNVRKAIAATEGVMACQISKDSGEVTVVFDDFFVTIDNIIESIEDHGYTVI
ncbi:MAG: heavy-metal-associated domain-containing protein [Clostridiaceae bacterium]